MSGDEEKDIAETPPPDGYPSLADFIAKHRDHSTAIYRHYDDLSARNILYLQSELAELRAQQIAFDREDAEPGEIDAQERARNWTMFKTLAEEPGGHQREQARMKLMLKIRGTLKEYREALLQESQMLAFRPPTKQAHRAFCWKFNMDSDDDQNSLLLGDSWDLYKDRNELIALARPAEEDRLTMVFRKFLPSWFLSNVTRDGRVASFDDSKIRRTVAVISFCIASALLYGAILNFYYVRDERAVLGLIAVWTVAFALCVGLLTNAKRSEIFSASAAYAAVIVVFISNPLGSPNGVGASGSGTQCSCR